MNTLFRFTAFNTECLYGWGDEGEAARYCDHLNRSRDINCYNFYVVTDVDEISRREANQEGVNLSDELIAIEEWYLE